MATKSTLKKVVERMLYFSPFVFPLYLFRFKLLGLPFTVLEVYSYALFALYLWALFRGQIKLLWEKPLKYAYLLAFFLLLGAIWGTLSVPADIILPGGETVIPIVVALGVLKGWILAPMLFFLVFTQVCASREQVQKILLSFVYSAGLLSLASYFFALTGMGFAPDLRLIGFFESANYLALYLLPALILGLYLLFEFKKLKGPDRWLCLLSVTLTAHALLLTQSYGAVLALFGSLGLYILTLLFRHRVSFKKLLIGGSLMLISLVILILTQLNSPKFQQFLDWEHRSSTSVRLEIYQVSLQLIKDHPLTGVGPGLFQSFYQTQAPPVLGHIPLEWNMPHPHNIFLAFWLNAGILGLLSLLGFIFLAHRKFTYPLLAFWAILIHGLVDVPFWKNDLAMIFWLVLGSIFILQSLEAKKKSSRY